MYFLLTTGQSNGVEPSFALSTDCPPLALTKCVWSIGRMSKKWPARDMTLVSPEKAPLQPGPAEQDHEYSSRRHPPLP